MSSNRIKNIAIVGVSGQQGTYITDALLKAGHFNITAITRYDSTSKIPEGVKAAKVDYSKPETIVEALKGQDVFIVTLSVMAEKGAEFMLYKAASDAKVPFVMPNDWGFAGVEDDLTMARESIVGIQKVESRKYIRELGGSSFITVGCGFWYVYSLSNGPITYGFSFPRKEVTFIDDGNTKINTSTHEDVAIAVTNLLSLPIEKEDGHSGKVVSDWKNKVVCISSFLVSQRDMFESVLRVTGDKESDWKITHENHKERYDAALKKMYGGDRHSFGVVLYTRLFYPDGSGNFGDKYGLDNEVLKLPKEDLDARTKQAIETSKTSMWGRL